ncbi:MAG: histidine kinase, partial [Bacteroidia bacterium]|nr:histidine kinase [Bacteroidia bacterium]
YFKLHDHSKRTETNKLYSYDLVSKKINPLAWPPYMGSEIIKLGNSYFKLFNQSNLTNNTEINKSNDLYISPLAHNGQHTYSTVFNRKLIIYTENKGVFTVSDSTVFQYPIHPKNFICAKNNIYLCFNDNILRYDLVTKTIVSKSIKPNISPTGINFDHENNIWITTLNKGIFMVPDYNIHSMFDTFVGKGKINTIAINKGTMIAGSNTGNIYVFDQLKPAQSFQLKDGNISIDQILFMPNDDFYAFREIKKRQKSTFYQNTENPILMQFSIQYKNGSVIFSKGNTLQILKNGQLFDIGRKAKLNYIRSLAYYNNRLWVGTISGLFHFNIEGDTLADGVTMSNLNPVFANRINNIQSFRDGLLVSVFGAGLIYLHKNSVTPINIPILDPSVLINKIIVYSNNQVMLLTNFGLYTINFPQTNSLKLGPVSVIDLRSGLNSNFINDAAFESENIWIATNSGINKMHISDLEKNPTKPIVNILGIQTRDSIYPFQKNIVLQPQENSFIIKFEGLCFKKPDQFPFYRYAWLSNNNDTVWNYTNDRNIQLMNVKPGVYTFILTARSKSGDWANVKVMKIEVLPHFYQTWWFLALCLLIFSIILWYIFKTRIRRIQEKEIQKNTVEVYGFKTKEAELKALRNQMNPHFIYNSLNSIQRYMITKDFETANAYITKFSQLIRTGLTMSKLEYISLEKEIAFIKNYLELEQMRFENLFTYSIIIEPNVDVEMLNIPSLLIQPLLENSIKHGFKHITHGGIIKIAVRKVDNDHLEIILEDNGCGLTDIKNPSTSHEVGTSMGIEIVKQRIHLLKEKVNDANMTFELTNIETGVRAKIILPYTE